MTERFDVTYVAEALKKYVGADVEPEVAKSLTKDQAESLVDFFYNDISKDASDVVDRLINVHKLNPQNMHQPRTKFGFWAKQKHPAWQNGEEAQKMYKDWLPNGGVGGGTMDARTGSGFKEGDGSKAPINIPGLKPVKKSTSTDVTKSIAEEAKAVQDYTDRAKKADADGNTDAAKLFRELAGEEGGHHTELQALEKKINKG